MIKELKRINATEYKAWLKDLKLKVRQTQIKASVKVNTVMLEFYWNLGADIVEKQKEATWGSGFLKQLSDDLMFEFSEIKGFSYRNIRFIKQWYLFYNEQTIKWKQLVSILDSSKGKQAVSLLTQIPWGHNILIVQKSNSLKQALFYVSKTLEFGWSRTILTHQIESALFEREGKAITNFSETLPKPQSDLANEMIKDPYKFDFLNLRKDFNERELEDALLDHITNFLLELGAGFAFIGRQKALQVGKKEFFVDLLFYHTQMHCYVVVELKTVDFEPEFAGKLNFYLKAVDMQIKTDRDEPTIGLLLCKSKDKLVVEYALSDVYKPMAVSEYHLTHILPDKLKSNLPTIEDIKAEFRNC